MAPPKKSKPSLWQSLTHSPSQSYLSQAPTRARKTSASSSAASFTSPRITSPSISSFTSDSNTNDGVGGGGWVHPSLRQAMKADKRYELVRSSEVSYAGDNTSPDSDEAAASARRKERRARKKKKAAEEEQRQIEYDRQMHELAHGGQPEFDLVKLESDRVRRTLRQASGDGSQGDRGEGSSTGGSVRERETRAQYGSSPNESPRPLSPLEAPRRPHAHSRTDSYSSSNSGSTRVSRFGSPSLGTVAENSNHDGQPARQPAYFDSSSRGGWNTSPSAPPLPPPNEPLPPAPAPPRNPRRPSMSPHAAPSLTPPNHSAAFTSAPAVLGRPLEIQTLTPPDSEVGLGISMSKREPARATPLDTARIGEILLERKPSSRRKSVATDGASSDEDVFYTPRSSMYSIMTAASPDPPSPPRSPSPVNTTPVLTLQPPTPNEFPIGSDTRGTNGNSAAPERDMFSEHSFHPDRVQTEVLSDDSKSPSTSPNISPPRKGTRQASSLQSRREGSRSPSFVSSPLSQTAEDDDEDAYSGLAYDDPPAPPRFPSETRTSSRSSTGSSASSRPIHPLTPSSTATMSPPISTNPLSSTRPPPAASSSVPAHLRPLPRSRPGSVYSTMSTSSRYSQASYRSEVDAPPPIIIPSPAASRPQSPSISPNQTPSLGSFASSTPFLPRPTSTLLDSYEGYSSYPSAPPSVLSEGGAPRRKSSMLSFGSDVGGGGGGGSRTKSERERRASESVDGRSKNQGGGKSRKAASEVGGAMSTVSTYRMPQVMGGAASLADGQSTSLSGGSGYSTLTLPSGAYRPEKSPARRSLSLLASATRPLSVIGLPTTTISTLSLLSTPPPPSPHQPLPTLSISYTSHTPPPTKLAASSVLVRIWAVALDGHDASTARRAERGWVPGRSWVGKVVECGEGCKGGSEWAKGEWVYGLLPGGGGAAKEFVVVDRRWMAACPDAGRGASEGARGMTLEDVASLPMLGVTAHRAVGAVARGSRALVLLGDGNAGGSDWGVGVLAAQELLARGVVVVLQVPQEWGGEVWAREAVDSGGKVKLKEGNVKEGDAVEVVHGEHEGSFDFVLDCVGGTRLYDASRRILVTGGEFASTKPLPTSATPSSSTSANPLSAFRRSFSTHKRSSAHKSLSHTILPPSGSGAVVDAHGEDVRDVLEWIAATRPYRVSRVGKVVPFERGGEAFGLVGGVAGGGGGGGKKGKEKAWKGYACEEEVWGVRLVQ